MFSVKILWEEEIESDSVCPLLVHAIALLSEQSQRKRDTCVPFPFCLRQLKPMFPTLQGNGCGQGEDSGFVG